jgi:hypothetical protein
MMGARQRPALLLVVAIVAVLILLAAPEERVIAIILIKRKVEADSILSRIRAGESFEQLARQHSVDPSAEEGGYLGKVKIEELRTELQAALKDVGPGEVSPVFQTAAGYMILKALPRPREDTPAVKDTPITEFDEHGFGEDSKTVVPYPTSNFSASRNAIQITPKLNRSGVLSGGRGSCRAGTLCNRNVSPGAARQEPCPPTKRH